VIAFPLIVKFVAALALLWRRYHVIYPIAVPEEVGSGLAWTRRRATMHTTFRRAVRVAVKARGARIYNVRDMSYTHTRLGWSESANGYTASTDRPLTAFRP
jgi:hypothetical protein